MVAEGCSDPEGLRSRKNRVSGHRGEDRRAAYLPSGRLPALDGLPGGAGGPGLRASAVQPLRPHRLILLGLPAEMICMGDMRFAVLLELEI
jgi:hypothetical protein